MSAGRLGRRAKPEGIGAPPSAAAPPTDVPVAVTLRRVVAGHPRAFAAFAAGLLAWVVLAYLPPGKMPDWPGQTRAILA